MKGFHRFAIVLVFCVAVTTLDCPAAESPAGPAAAKWVKTYGQWKDALAGLRELRDKYLLAEEDEHDALRAKYATLLAEAHDLVEQLRVDGVAADADDPQAGDVRQHLRRDIGPTNNKETPNSSIHGKRG